MEEDVGSKTNWELIFQKYKLLQSKGWLSFLFLFIGLALLGGAIFLIKNQLFNGPKIEILDEKVAGENTQKNEIIVEISGAVEKPGVYHLPTNSRIEDLLIISDGLSGNADRVWVDKNLNRAAKLTDGQKIYVPIPNQQSVQSTASKTAGEASVVQYDNETHSNLINISEATLSELDSLPGIGQVYAQKIIDNRPYSNIEELISKKVLPQSTFDKIKDKISVY